MAQGKQENWEFGCSFFQTGNLSKNIKNLILHREFIFNTGKSLKFKKFKDFQGYSGMLSNVGNGMRLL